MKYALAALLLLASLGGCSLNDVDERDYEDWYSFEAFDRRGDLAAVGQIGFYRIMSDVIPGSPDELPGHTSMGGIHGRWAMEGLRVQAFGDAQGEGRLDGRVRLDDSLEFVLALPRASRTFGVIGLQEGDVIRGRWEAAEFGEVESKGAFEAHLLRRSRHEPPSF